MLDGLRRLMRQRRNAKEFASLPAQQRRIVFYSEGPGYWVHFEPIVSQLWQAHEQPVVYLTSAEDDPVLSTPPGGVLPFYIGDGTVRTLLFAGLECGVMVMTMPDLQSYHIKRSPHGVHYAYIHHSIVSCHMIYRQAAFDHFDSVFCVGPHHVKELRAREAQAGLPAKNLVEHGYGRLEALIDELDQAAQIDASRAETAVHILVAPSWGRDALLERHGIDFIEPLLDAGYRVTLRPHPQTGKFRPDILDEALARFGEHEGFVLDQDMASKRSLLDADVMVSDWSGAALEFAFALLKPVLFVDVPRKINNPDYEALGIEPLEVWVRERIGRVVPEGELRGAISDRVSELLGDRQSWRDSIATLREQYVYNLGQSGTAGAKALMEIAGGNGLVNGRE